MQDARNFHYVITDAIENCVGTNKNRSELRHHLIACPPHERPLCELLARLIDLAKQFVRNLRRRNARVIAPDLA